MEPGLPIFRDFCEQACVALWGEPSTRNARQLRWNGPDAYSPKTFSVRKKAWYDHGEQRGGSTLDLVAYSKGEPKLKLKGQAFFETWAQAYEMGLVPEPPPEKRNSGAGNPIRATYPYRDEGGRLLFEVVRFDTAVADDRFRQRRPDGEGGWIWDTKGVRTQVLYRLPELIAAVKAGQRALVTEGEKDAETAVALGFAATTAPGGVNKWRAAYDEYFRDADVVVVSDNDPQAKDRKTGEPQFHPNGKPVLPGQDHAANVARHLRKVAAQVRTIILPQKDLTAWRETGGDKAALEALIDEAPDQSRPLDPFEDPDVDYLPEPEPPRANGPADASEDWNKEGSAFGYSWQWHWHGESDPRDERKYLIESILPETGVGLISGQWGTYKTFVADDLAAAVMTSTDFITFKVQRTGGVLFLACEGQKEVAIRLTAAFEARGGKGKAPFAWVDGCPRLTDKNAAKILIAMVKHGAEMMRQRFGLDVVLAFVDTAGKAAGLSKEGQLNDDAIAKVVMKALADVAVATGIFFIGVAHFGKNVETGTKGSTGFEDDADVVLALLGERGLNGVVSNPRMCLRKRRAGANGDEFAFDAKVVDLGPGANGKPVTTLTLDWSTEAQTPSAKAKPDRWAKSLRLLRQVMMTFIADCGSEQRPFADGPIVRAVDLELVREAFYKRYPATGEAKTKLHARQKAFSRAVKDASEKGLIAISDIGIVTYVWLVATEGGRP